ncbi:DUF6358 family protein [Mucilaginibacter calamicampi]|uniref:DUF6358 family protein n=1 Tax=Mucilaginibacter calamicampi TaxID=1302352 RepID=A0ABW2Z2D5_9SPHI
MGKQIILNTLYNVGIFISLMTAYWGFNNQRYEYVAAGVIIAALFVFLKIKIIKQVRSNIKK